MCKGAAGFYIVTVVPDSRLFQHLEVVGSVHHSVHDEKKRHPQDPLLTAEIGMAKAVLYFLRGTQKVV